MCEVFAPACLQLACGVSACIVDPETSRLLPQGLVGELYVGGATLSYGYHGSPEITAKKFSEGVNPEIAGSLEGLGGLGLYSLYYIYACIYVYTYIICLYSLYIIYIGASALGRCRLYRHAVGVE